MEDIEAEAQATKETPEKEIAKVNPFDNLSWNSLITFGPHVGTKFLNLLIKEKAYLKKCVADGSIVTNSELKWIWDHIKQAEKSLIMHGNLSPDKLKG